MATIQFLGAARTVTGSKHLVEVDGYRTMVDCGLFQGLKELRMLNWEPFPLNPAAVNSVILTHAHIDHTGYLPKLVRDGFDGPVYATPATVELARILLPDSARLQEEDAAYANKSGSSKHKPALPLYSERNANEALRLMESVNYNKNVQLTKKLSFEFVTAGHIIGSSFVLFAFESLDGRRKRMIMTGDLGRYNEPIIPDPSNVDEADYIVVESTYGDRNHPEYDVKARLAEIINETARLGGHILIPAFAIGRTQQLLYLIRELEEENRIPILPVFVDSPMAVSATKLYLRHAEDHDLEMKDLMDERRNPLATKRFNLARTVQESKEVSAEEESTIVISASGMATGGRILHHLRKRLPDEHNTVIFAGFQAKGTRGRRLVDGEREVKIYGEFVPVRARIERLENLSAHADSNEILRWLGGFKRAPEKVFLVHGEPDAQTALKDKIIEKFGWDVEIPEYLQKYEL
ncbi:MAG TPA: MBL fold metallo-hydrolase [Blastocatellia bacterium]|nr:MBL fold metallo-hydrolase [Blastocatellia bacterium]